MTPLNAVVAQAAKDHDQTLGEWINSHPVGQIITFMVIAGAIVFVAYRWMTRPFKKRGR